MIHLACSCFINPAGVLSSSAVPLLRTLKIEGFELLVPRQLSKRLNAPGELGAEMRDELAALLAGAFPSSA